MLLAEARVRIRDSTSVWRLPYSTWNFVGFVAPPFAAPSLNPVGAARPSPKSQHHVVVPSTTPGPVRKA